MWDRATGHWRKLHHVMWSFMIRVLHPLLFGWSSQASSDGWGRYHIRGTTQIHIGSNGETWRRQHGELRWIWKDTIKKDLNYIRCGCLHGIHLVLRQGQVSGSSEQCMKLSVPQHIQNILTSWASISFSRGMLLHAARERVSECVGGWVS